MESNSHGGDLRSMDEVDPQANQWLAAISLGELAWTKKLLLCTTGNVRKWHVLLPLNIALGDRGYKNHFLGREILMQTSSPSI